MVSLETAVSISSIYSAALFNFFYFRKVAAAQDFKVIKYLFCRPIPPLNREKLFNECIIKSFFYKLARVSSCNVIGRDILYHDRISSDNRTIADLHTRHYCNILSNPHIVTNHSISFEWQLCQFGSCFFPAVAHDVERIGGNTAHSMVCTVHYKFNSFCNCAKFADYELVSDKLIMVCDVFLERFGTVTVIIIGIVTNYNIGTCDYIKKY